MRQPSSPNLYRFRHFFVDPAGRSLRFEPELSSVAS